jgi:AcrR family transcriptional regulator
MKTGTEPKRRRLSAERRQEEIVGVALGLAAERGVDAVTTQDMAMALGLTQGAIFRHFPTKDDIWAAAIRWIRSNLMAVVGAAAAQGDGPLDALERMFFAHVSFIAKHPAIPRLVFSDQLLHKHPQLKQMIQELVTRYEAKLAALFKAAGEQGLTREGLDERSASTLFIGMIQGLVIQSTIFAGQRSLVDEAKKVFPVFLAGIRKPE